jgi:bifunctional non-homologous end joining protein LigD
MGTWEPLSPVTVDGKYVPTNDQEARTMLSKGDLKFHLNGEKLKGDFALVKMRGRRPGSKGNEWLLIKKHDAHEVEDYDIDQYDSSVLTKRSMDEIAGDDASREWRSRPSGRGGRVKAAWLSDAIAKYDKKKAAEKKPTAEGAASADQSAEKPTSKAATKTKKAKQADAVDIREASEKKTLQGKKLKSA